MYMYQAAAKPMSMAMVDDARDPERDAVNGFDQFVVDDERAGEEVRDVLGVADEDARAR